jgi:hypothetical protein
MAAVVSGRQTANQKEHGREGRESDRTRPLPRTRGVDPTGYMGLMRRMGVMLVLENLIASKDTSHWKIHLSANDQLSKHTCRGRGTRTTLGKTGKLSRRRLERTDAADMLKRRLKQAGLPAHCSPHSFRATGIANFLENDGSLEVAERIAGHADSRTTKLYDRRGQKVLLEDMERNAELGIPLQMSSAVKCGVSRMNVLWERILE